MDTAQSIIFDVGVASVIARKEGHHLRNSVIHELSTESGATMRKGPSTPLPYFSVLKKGIVFDHADKLLLCDKMVVDTILFAGAACSCGV